MPDIMFPFAVDAIGGSIIGASITALAAATVAIYLNAVGRKREDDTRRRDLYSRAYRAGLAWEECLYRVRRRADDDSENGELRNRLHGLQEETAYYYGWLSIESAELGTSYKAFITAVKTKCEPLLRDAWATPPCPVEKPLDGPFPDLDVEKEAYLREVRKRFVGPLRTL